MNLSRRSDGCSNCSEPVWNHRPACRICPSQPRPIFLCDTSWFGNWPGSYGLFREDCTNACSSFILYRALTQSPSSPLQRTLLGWNPAQFTVYCRHGDRRRPARGRRGQQAGHDRFTGLAGRERDLGGRGQGCRGGLSQAAGRHRRAQAESQHQHEADADGAESITRTGREHCRERSPTRRQDGQLCPHRHGRFVPDAGDDGDCRTAPRKA